MLDNARVLEIYVDFITVSMKELERICAYEKELLQKSNLFNRNKNLQLIYQEYQQYLEKIEGEWVKIYSNSNHYWVQMHTGGKRK